MTPQRIKIIAGLAALLLVLFALYAWRQSYLASSFEKHASELQAQKEAAEKRSAEAEGRAMENKQAAQAKELQIADANARADASDRALGATRNITVSLKGAYDQARNRPVDATVSVSVADACAKLESLGYQCK